MHKYKKINIGLVLASLLIVICVHYYWKYICADGGCSFELRNSFLRPLYWFGIGLSLITCVLLFFPVEVFKKWLLYLFSWFFPLAVMGVLDTRPTGGGPFGIGRDDIAIFSSYVLGALTLLFLCIYYLHAFFVRRKQKKSAHLN